MSELLNASTLFAEAELSAERVKSTLARALHDELGSLLVAALMDADWAENQADLPPGVRNRLCRIKDVLSRAVKKQRGLLEGIRPSLLDTMGLFAALRWHHRKTCEDASLRCSSSYPDDELPLTDCAATSLFRIIEAALLAAANYPLATSLHLGISRQDNTLSIEVHHDGDVLPRQPLQPADEVRFALLEHRVRALGGGISIASLPAGGMQMTATFPLQNVVLN